MRSTEATIFYQPPTEEGRYLPEGPQRMRVAGKQLVAWVDIQTSAEAKSGSIYLLDMDRPQSVRRIACPRRPGFFRPIVGGDRALVGFDKELQVGDLSSGTWERSLATIPNGDPRTMNNDGSVVPGGKAIVFGTKDTQFKEPIANLYLYTVDDNRVSVLADKQTCSNGKVFARDSHGLILYDIDTPTHKVARYRLDVAARTATPDGVAVDVSNQVGSPDGMCDCGDGTAIIAFYNPDFAAAGQAIRFNLSTGGAIEKWTTPGSPRVTCPLLVKRPDGVKLILTTATEGMPAEMRAKCPNAGCLFIADTSLSSCPEPEVVRLEP